MDEKNIRSSFLKISDLFMKVFSPVQMENVIFITQQKSNYIYKKNSKQNK